MIRTCFVSDCNNEANVPGSARGLCAKHYRRLQRHGDPLGRKARKLGSVKRWVAEVALKYEGEECLSWPFVRSKKGYAHWTVGGRPQNASRVICQMFHGKPPSQKHVCAHSCFNGHLGCVNPHHLRWATVSENEMDKVLSGTSNRGEQHGMSKLTESDVRSIRALSQTMTQQEIAKQFGVSKWTVGDIIRRKRWGWLK